MQYCAKASVSFSKAQTTFFDHGLNRMDSVAMAADYCAKDSEIAKAAAEYCAKAGVPESVSFSKAQTTFFNHGPNQRLVRKVRS